MSGWTPWRRRSATAETPSADAPLAVQLDEARNALAAKDRRIRELTADVLALGATPRQTWPGNAFRIAGGGL